jgi:hypothetical protein
MGSRSHALVGNLGTFKLFTKTKQGILQVKDFPESQKKAGKSFWDGKIVSSDGVFLDTSSSIHSTTLDSTVQYFAERSKRIPHYHLLTSLKENTSILSKRVSILHCCSDGFLLS